MESRRDREKTWKKVGAEQGALPVTNSISSIGENCPPIVITWQDTTYIIEKRVRIVAYPSLA